MKNVLEELDKIISERKGVDPQKSYVASILKKGTLGASEKTREEFEELINACINESKSRVISEAADLWFHSMILLSLRNANSIDILKELESRFGISGHEEKKSRKS